MVGVAVTSAPSANDTYGLAETIRVTLTFSEAVAATTSSRLNIDMDPAHWARSGQPAKAVAARQI